MLDLFYSAAIMGRGLLWVCVRRVFVSSLPNQRWVRALCQTCMRQTIVVSNGDTSILWCKSQQDQFPFSVGKLTLPQTRVKPEQTPILNLNLTTDHCARANTHRSTN